MIPSERGVVKSSVRASPMPDTVVQQSSACLEARRLGLFDARMSRPRRSLEELVDAIAPHDALASDVHEVLFSNYTSVFDKLTIVGGYYSPESRGLASSRRPWGAL
jgi:hypothetical protein